MIFTAFSVKSLAKQFCKTREFPELTLRPFNTKKYCGNSSYCLAVKVTLDLRGCLPVCSGKKIHMHAILNESTANYLSLESLINVDFGKKYQLPVFFNSTKENCKNDRKNDHASFNQTNELTGYQNSADFCEIWPEHSLDVVKQKCVGDF